MRLLVKDPSNVERSFEHMQCRFTNFYSGAKGYRRTIPQGSWQKLKLFLTSSSMKIQVTWVKLIAKAENRLEASNKDAGLLKYLAWLVFSNTGMHAYNFFIDLKTKTNVPYTWLLNAMKMRLTKAALSEIHTIITRYESEPGNRRTTYFRYARLLGPQYFTALQTKECKSLVYLEACLLKKYASFGKEQDPMQIVALNALPTWQKNFLNIFAEEIYKAIKDGQVCEEGVGEVISRS
ncbi:uncharacterized protein LOC143857795 isoform X2 [Tasmannia lanceolata]|uniref:uncharacterized protein LOC143857795 isoform X2 n=1 Tax=Tasmannia lanceolata TaxID=3420 RepID=UPI004063EC90